MGDATEPESKQECTQKYKIIGWDNKRKYFVAGGQEYVTRKNETIIIKKRDICALVA